MTAELRTRRLLLRRWAEPDLLAFAAINADPTVMATLGPLLSRESSDAFVQRIEACVEEQGWGLWCVEVIGGRHADARGRVRVERRSGPFGA